MNSEVDSAERGRQVAEEKREGMLNEAPGAAVCGEVGTNSTSTETRKEGGAMARSCGGGHGD
jgi:hypothetical protein